MQFSNFTRVETGNKIIFSTLTPLKGIKNIKYYQDNATGSFDKKEFRWSFNGDYWASWEVLNQGNVSGIAIGNNTNLFLEIRYSSAGNGKVTSFIINYEGAAQVAPAGGNCPPDSNYIPSDKNINDEANISSKCHPDGTIDADTLCGKPCDYYLWRPNHKGQQPISTITDLQKILGGLSAGIQNSVTGGQNLPGTPTSIGVFYDKIGQDLLFRQVDASGPGLQITEQDGVIYFTVDASFSYDDASINQLYDFYYALESNLNDISIYVDTKFLSTDASIVRIDSSINDLYSKLGGDSSIYGIENIGGEASIYSDTVLGIARLRTIRGSGGISVYVDGSTLVIDGSISGGDSSIVGVINIGGAPGEVFSAIDPSGNIELRTIDGSGATSVITSGDKIIISTDVVSDSSIKSIINIGAGEGLVLANIDASGIAELRTITGTGAISVTQTGDEIVLYSDASITVDPCTWSDTDPISADVGGLVSGDVINPGTNSIQILEDILYEYFPPNVSMQIDPSPGPTSSTGFYEKWVDTPIAQGASLTYYFNNNDFTKVRVYDVSIFENGAYYRTDSWGGLASIPPYTTFDNAPDIGTASIDLTYDFNFGNKVGGTDMPNYDTSVGLRWVDPYFYGTVAETVNYTNITNADILGLGNKIILPEQTNEVSYDVSANFVKIKFVYAYPASYADLRTIFDVKNDFNVTTSFDSSIVNVKMSGLAGPGPYVPYKVYIKNHWISFNQDVSIFKLIFNI